MLAARRDPVFDHGAQGSSSSAQGSPPPGHPGAHAAPRPTGFARLISGLQILGTVLGIPLGLASGYSVYRANFSPEATCGSLRASIISMLDKNADATTLRLLVRRDVASFEHSCGAVDPDAVAAFKTLLARPRTVAAKAPAELVKPAEPAKHAAHADPSRRVAHEVSHEHAEGSKRAKAEAAKLEAAKQEEAAKERAKADTEAARARRTADADWLDAVRQALVQHAPVTRAQAAEAPATLLPPPPAAHPMGSALPVQPQAAPALPPATAVAATPAPRGQVDHQVDHHDDHPVPPAPIPNVDPPPVH